MSEEQKYPHDQAESLRGKMFANKSNQDTYESLPPRSKKHQTTKKKVKWKMQYPLIRLLVILFILIVVTIQAYSIWSHRMNNEKQTSYQEQPENEVEYEKGNTSTNSDEDEYEIAVTSQVVEKKDGSSLQGEVISANKETGEAGKSTDDNNNGTNKEKVEESSKPVAQETKYIIHTVKSGETLYRVSMKYFNSRRGEAIIRQLNDLGKNGTIYTGQKLKIPMSQ